VVSVAITDADLLAGRYRVIRPLGAGGAGSVVLARDERLDRLVAVKRMHVDAPAEVVRRFRREARIGAALSHPNLVTVYDAVSDGDGVLIAMEYVPGETLAQVLRRGPLAPAEVVRVIEAVAEALDHVHESGIVHRDVKPANILLDGDVVKLADLGISTSPDEARVTGTGTVVGTATYMAPEQFEGRGTGAPADVFSLAAVAFECLSGRLPRTGATLIEIAHRAVTEPPPDLRSVMPGAPPALAQLLLRAMDRDPRVRPRSAGLLAGMIEAEIELEDDDNDDAAVEVDDGARHPSESVGAAAIVNAAPPSPVLVASGGARREHPQVRRGLVVLLALLALAAGAAIVRVGLDGEDGRRQAGSGSTSGETASGSVAGVSTTIEPAPAPAPAPTAVEPPPAPAATTTAEAPATAPATTPERPQQVSVTDSAPAEAVRAFYERSALDDFEGGWALLGTGARAQMRSFGTYRATLRSLTAIEFEDLRTTREGGGTATVAFSTVARHTDRTDRCSGTAEVSGSGASWQIERFSVGC